MKYYKFLRKDGHSSEMGFDYSDYLLGGSKSGKWLPKIGKISVGWRGYHVLNKENFLLWAGDVMWVVDARGMAEEEWDKTAVQQIRFIRKIRGWNKKNLLLAAKEVVELLRIEEPAPTKAFKLKEVADWIFLRAYLCDKEKEVAEIVAARCGID